MAEIKCPKCGEIIKLDKSSYDSLLSEIEGEEISKRVNERTREIEDKLIAEFKLKAAQEKDHQSDTINSLETEVKVLKEKLNSTNKDTELAVSKAKEAMKDSLANKDKEIIELRAKINETIKDADLKANELEKKYLDDLSKKDEEIEKWRSYRYKDSTKDIGESLEVYCHDLFEGIRNDAYPNAYFEKDNTVVEGSKADFIFRDYSKDGIELVSIIFDMKTEKDTTEKKKKNFDHLEKLDENRRKKGCEYAVLVSTLEADSELYNRGIVDVSHRFPKMYVVRPQLFLAIIGLIRNMALKSYEYKKQVAVYQQQHVDVTNFENAVQSVADKIKNDYIKADNLYNGVEAACDAMIKKLTDLKEDFRKARGHIGAAQNQLENLTVRKLTKNNETMKARFEAVENKDE